MSPAACRQCGVLRARRCAEKLHLSVEHTVMADTQDETPYHTRTDIQPSSRLAKHRAPVSSVDGDAESESESDISVELASTAASGSENRLYLRLALYAGGNILTLVLVLGLWTVWTLLSTFRNPMLWALLCSTALQDVKEDLIIGINCKLSQDRSVSTLSAPESLAAFF